MSMERIWLAIAGASGAIAVAVDAMARHLLAGDAARVDWASTGARYGLVHAVALVALVGASRVDAAQSIGWPLMAAGWCFVAGSVLFCGSLYLLAAGASFEVARAAPIGGSLFIVGWIAVLVAALRPRPAR
jgi:uncharacterized membrane protein YgdD (TMEM256/DUF423 family)